MGKLQDWDFINVALNSTTQQINRQKSAMNLKVELINDKQEAIFIDPRNGRIKASLESCECKDFNFSGDYPRKKFLPCMHIYRLAIELKLMQAQYYDKKNRWLSAEERKVAETKRIREIDRDPTLWGRWGEMVHSARSQNDRQLRAYDIFLANDYILQDENNARVSAYFTTLETCMCADFEERRVPCKHIYCLALAKGHELKITLEDYKIEKEQFKKFFVPLIEIKLWP